MSEPQPSEARPTVFFVDDDEDVRTLTARLLTHSGYQVIQASSAQEASRIIEEHKERIDVLLMDINLPDGWGAIVAQRLIQHHPEMVIVYTTGFAKSDPILSGALHDATHVLPKPFTARELLGTLERALEERED